MGILQILGFLVILALGGAALVTYMGFLAYVAVWGLALGAIVFVGFIAFTFLYGIFNPGPPDDRSNHGP